MKRKVKVLMVTYWDHSRSEEVSFEQFERIKNETIKFTTVGFLVHEDEEKITLCPDFSHHTSKLDGSLDFQDILKATIIKKNVLTTCEIEWWY